MNHMNLTRTQVLERLSARQFPLGGVTYQQTKDITVDLVEQNINVVFDLSRKEDFLFFAELSFLLELVNDLESNVALQPLIQDEYPDFFSFAFSSLQVSLCGGSPHNKRVCERDMESRLTNSMLLFTFWMPH